MAGMEGGARADGHLRRRTRRAVFTLRTTSTTRCNHTPGDLLTADVSLFIAPLSTVVYTVFVRNMGPFILCTFLILTPTAALRRASGQLWTFRRHEKTAFKKSKAHNLHTSDRVQVHMHMRRINSVCRPPPSTPAAPAPRSPARSRGDIHRRRVPPPLRALARTHPAAHSAAQSRGWTRSCTSAVPTPTQRAAPVLPGASRGAQGPTRTNGATARDLVQAQYRASHGFP